MQTHTKQLEQISDDKVYVPFSGGRCALPGISGSFRMPFYKATKKGTMNTVKVVVERIHPGAKLPTYAHGYEEDAGCDLYAVEDRYIPPSGVVMVPTGIKLSMPPGVQAEVRSKSGLATRGVHVVNSPGTVDPSYRGEIVVIMGCLRPVGIRNGHQVCKGDKIAQIVFMPYLGADITEGPVENDTLRGEGGFGSTGK